MKSVGASLLILVFFFAPACASHPQFESVEPTLESFEPFDIPLEVNTRGVASLSLETSEGPIEFLLDTGADQALLIRAGAPVEDQLTRIGSEWKANAAGRMRLVPVYAIPEINLGPLQFTNVRAPVEHAKLPSYMPGQAVLGRGMLEGLTLDIDMPASRFGVLPSGALPDDFEDHDWITTDLVAINDGPVIRAQIDDSESTVRLVLDTGAITSHPDGAFGIVELPSDLTSDPSDESRPPIYRAQSVRIGEADIGPMSFYDMVHRFPRNTEGFLGNVLFPRFRVLIDPAARKVHLLEAD